MAWSVRLYVRMSSVTLVHPAQVAGQNVMPLGRDTRVVPSNTVLDMVPGPSPRKRGDLGVDAACRQVTQALVANLLLSMPVKKS